MNQVKSFFALVGGLIATALLLAMLVMGWHVVMVVAPFLVGLFILLLVYWLVAGTVGASLHLWVMGRLKAERFELHTGILHPHEGNYPVIYRTRHRELIAPPPGRIAQPVPHTLTWSPHYSSRDTMTRVTEEEQPVAHLPGIEPPTLDALIEQVPYNGLHVCLGVSATTGVPFTMDLLDGTHYRIIGGSGFGKSCQAAGMLDQLTQSNDADHLLIALLDLEHKTSRLFENREHVARLQVGRKMLDCVATSPDEVARHFGYLRRELDRRKTLSEYDLERERFLLIYVEEFLSLRREVDPDLLEQMMKDFSILALRGRKYGLYLLACAQVDYAAKDLRDAMNQFNVNMSFCVKPPAARAAGFSSNDLLKQNFAMRKRGQFVLETTGCADLMLAPRYDVRAKLRQLEGAVRGATGGMRDVLTSTIHGAGEVLAPSGAPAVAPAWQAYVEPISRLRANGFNQDEIIQKTWGAKKGTNAKYLEARDTYRQVVAFLDTQEGRDD